VDLPEQLKLHVYIQAAPGVEIIPPHRRSFFTQAAAPQKARQFPAGSQNMRRDYIIRKRFDIQFDADVSEKLADRTASFSDRRKGGKR